MGISLIMPTIGRSDEIHRLLDSLERQTSSAFELIIVDQNRDRLLAPVLRRLSESAISFKHLAADRKGLSSARNLGFPDAGQEIIGYPDDDCWYESEVVDEVVRYFQANPEVDGLIGRWCEKDGRFDEEFPLSGKRWRGFRIGIAASSICLFIRRGWVQKTGGFDERLGVPHWFGCGEETDFIMRCLALGANIRYVPSVRVHHPVRPGAEGGVGDEFARVRCRSRGTGALYRKHRLSFSVVLRGLLSPLLKSLAPPFSPRRMLLHLAAVLGRIEGIIRWHAGREEPSGTGASPCPVVHRSRCDGDRF